jgi:hypothetical protein
MIKQLPDGRFQLWHKDGSAPMGPPTTKEDAYRQEVAIWLAKRGAESDEQPAKRRGKQ